MAAVRNAMLSVSPTRLKNFSLAMENNLKEEAKSNHAKNLSKRRSGEDRKHRPHKSDKRKIKKSTSTSKKTSSKGRKKKHSHDKTRKKKTEKGDENLFKYDSDMELDGLDLKKKFLPLQNYLGDRETLLNQVFSIIKQEKMLTILPDDIKKKPFVDIKQKCMEQLQVMSNVRLEHVILGKELDFSSGTESPMDNDSLSTHLKVESRKQNSALQTNEVDSTTSEQVSSVTNSFPSASSQQAQQKVTSSNQTDSDKYESSYESSPNVVVEDELEVSDYEDMVDELLEGSLKSAISKECKQDSETSPEVDDIEEEDIENVQSDHSLEKEEKQKPKSRLEILELEMRARAIRSLMNNVNSNINKNSS